MQVRAERLDIGTQPFPYCGCGGKSSGSLEVLCRGSIHDNSSIVSAVQILSLNSLSSTSALGSAKLNPPDHDVVSAGLPTLLHPGPNIGAAVVPDVARVTPHVRGKAPRALHRTPALA